MHHLLGKAQSDGSPEHKEGRAAEDFNHRNIAEHMHDTQAKSADHQDEQQAHELRDGDYYTPNSYIIDNYVYRCADCGEYIKTKDEL